MEFKVNSTSFSGTIDNNDKVDNKNLPVNNGDNISKPDNQFKIQDSLNKDFKPNIANGTIPISNTPSSNNFSGIQLNNNFFDTKQVTPTQFAGQTKNFIPSNIANNPLSNVHNTFGQGTNVTNMMDKPGFGAKSNLGMGNPLNVNYII